MSKFLIRLGMVFLCLGGVELNHLYAQDLPDSSSSQQVLPKEVKWSQLAPENGKPFNDPFSRLTDKQLSQLSFVVRIQRLVAEGKLEMDGTDVKEARRIVDEFKRQKVDVDWLMAHRDHVRKLREAQLKAVSKSVVHSFNSKTVTVTGYAKPVPRQQHQEQGFLLLPTTSMCSHATAPSPLQVIYVKSQEQYAFNPNGSPVRLTGMITADSKATPLVSANGVQIFSSAYEMNPTSIELLEKSQTKSNKPDK